MVETEDTTTDSMNLNILNSKILFLKSVCNILNKQKLDF